jgi:tetratricopeptide (TPR) repeat protein
MVVGGFILYYFGEQPMWVVFTFAAPIVVVYALAPLWAARSLAAFDRDSVRILAQRDPAQLKARYARALGMRLFAPAGELAERKAMVMLECGAFRAAQAAFREALDELGSAASDRVLVGAAHASFAVADHANAIVLYRRVLKGVGALPGVERKLALALVRHGEDLGTAVEILERTTHEVSAGAARQELLLVRALAHAKLGDAQRAQAALVSALEQCAVESDAAKDLHIEVNERIAQAYKHHASLHSHS